MILINIFTCDSESGVLPVFGGRICGVFFDYHYIKTSTSLKLNGNLWRLYRAFEWGMGDIIPDLQIIVYLQLHNIPVYLKDEYSLPQFWDGNTLSPSDFYRTNQEDGTCVRILDGCSFATLYNAVNHHFSHYKVKMWW